MKQLEKTRCVGRRVYKLIMEFSSNIDQTYRTGSPCLGYVWARSVSRLCELGNVGSSPKTRDRIWKDCLLAHLM